MAIQIGLVSLFALNIALIWLAFYYPKILGWYRYLSAFLIVLIPLASVFFDQPKFELDYFWWRVAGAAAILIGIGLIVWAKTTFARFFTNPGAAPPALQTDGPYSLVRHPMYLGLIFIIVGWWWVWAAVYSFYFGMFMLVLIWIEAYLEEKLILEGSFKEAYREYRARTGMFWIK